ncbi:AfsR/SARP family transcriptional regulator [Frankia sp. Ag45/Mut15]|uniref:AfsR/SARP family transcriptional regulator n=1 Tax=Frankia umida TaxID=573489 RepID=A0ABT0K1Z1_9ACTN|nr:BTAD domain-containing putative transcriptional regulator [Frankia umida]MCK9877826.1 AfsR/SARP family transcriptional regulator [Frankia umida]
MSPTDPLHFGLLGPLEAHAGEESIKIGGPRHRTLLAILLLSADCVVSVDALIEGLWNGRSPHTGRGQIAICVSALRKALRSAGCADEIIQTVHPGYKLSSAHATIDLVQYTELVNQARALVHIDQLEPADRLFDQALALWRGDALAGIDSDLVRNEAANLDEQRLTVLEEHLTLKLNRGMHRTLIRNLTGLVRQHPLRERGRANLMLAQYRSGRRAEALDTFAEGRRLLIAEIGLEPGVELQNLQAAILRDDPSLLTPTTVSLTSPPVYSDRPSQLPVVPAELIDRGAELSSLDRLLSEPSGSRRRVGLITGTPGAGKTALAAHWAQQHAKDFPDGQMYADLDDGEQIQHPSVVLDQFLQALHVPPGQIPRALSDRTSLYRNVLDGRRLVVLLDNASSYSQIEPLLPVSGSYKVLITSRQPIAELYGDPAVTYVSLAELAQPAAVELLGTLVGRSRIRTSDPQTQRLAELCGRSPLAIRIAASRLIAKPHWTAADLVRRLEDPHRRLDELTEGEVSIRSSFASSYRHLQPEEARLFRLLGMLATPAFTVWLGAALIDASLIRTDQIMERLVDVQLLRVVSVDGKGRARYAFRELAGLYARELATCVDSAAELRNAVDRAHGALLALAENAHRIRYGADFAWPSAPAPRWLLPERQARELVADPQAWFELEQQTILAVVRQAVRRQQTGLAWQLAIIIAASRVATETARQCCSLAHEGAALAGDGRGVEAMACAAALLGYDEGNGRLRLALAEFMLADDRHGRSQVLARLAPEQTQCEPAEARRLFADALIELIRLAGLDQSLGQRRPGAGRTVRPSSS